MLRIASIATVYPNSVEPSLGCFVRARLQHMAKRARVRVIAPISVIDYARPMNLWFEGLRVPGQEWDVHIPVWRPKWIFPPNGGPATALCLVARLLPLMRSTAIRADILDAHFAFPEGVATAIIAHMMRRPYVVTLRGNEPQHAEYRFRRHLMTWALRRADRVIAVSNRLKEFAISLGVTAGKVTTIPNGVDTSVFYPRCRSLAIKKHGLPPGKKIILSVGALVERKGHHHVIHALKLLKKRGNANVHLVIAGGDGRGDIYGERLVELIRETDLEEDVRLFGPASQEAVAELMSAADVFCLASGREGWPNVVHEALACGAPVVATDVGAIPDLIPTARYGYVVPPSDQSALLDALDAAVNKDWSRPAISQWAHGRTWDHVAEEVLREMNTIVYGPA